MVFLICFGDHSASNSCLLNKVKDLNVSLILSGIGSWKKQTSETEVFFVSAQGNTEGQGVKTCCEFELLLLNALWHVFCRKPKFLAPEVLSQKPQLGTGDSSTQLSSGSKPDVWSLGMILLETFLVSDP